MKFDTNSCRSAWSESLRPHCPDTMKTTSICCITPSLFWHGSYSGECVGCNVGDLVGAFVGDVVGSAVGDLVGDVVGCAVGLFVGDVVGSIVGDFVGDVVGCLVGFVVGDFVGDVVGCLVGDVVGDFVGNSQISLVIVCCVVRPPGLSNSPVLIESKKYSSLARSASFCKRH